MSFPRNNPREFWHKELNPVIISGRWNITGGVGAVDVVVGQGFAITRDGAGDYLVTFTDAFSHLLCVKCGCSAISGVAVDMYAQPGAFTAGGTGACTLQIRTKTGAVSTDPAATDGVTFEAVLYGEALDR